jgi:hypothetical protein
MSESERNAVMTSASPYDVESREKGNFAGGEALQGLLNEMVRESEQQRTRVKAESK